jgi:hypothetical protein
VPPASLSQLVLQPVPLHLAHLEFGFGYSSRYQPLLALPVLSCVWSKTGTAQPVGRPARLVFVSTQPLWPQACHKSNNCKIVYTMSCCASPGVASWTVEYNKVRLERMKELTLAPPARSWFDFYLHWMN